MDLHEYVEDVARDAIHEFYATTFGFTGVDALAPNEAMVAHAVAEAVADLYAT